VQLTSPSSGTYAGRIPYNDVFSFMSYQVLARKYRPQHFADVIGQVHVTRTLGNALTQRRIAHGYIFSGHRGIGKTTIARILAMALNCQSSDGPVAEPCGKCSSCTEIRAGGAVDVIEIDAATNRGIDEIRELRDAARYKPARDRYKIYILDEAHQITDAAFNALLKTLEEPPPHIVFMMATTQPEDIPQTIRSRCQHFSFHAVKFEDIVGQLRSIAEQEGIPAEDEALSVLAEAGDGSMRDALSIMDQAIACCGQGEAISAAQVRGLVGTVASDVLEELMNTIAASSSQDALTLIDRLVTQGQSPTYLIRQLVRFLRNTLVAKVSGVESALLQISSDERTRVTRVATQFGEEDITRFLHIALRTHDELGYKQEQRFHLELGIMKMVHAQRLLPLEQWLSAQPVPTNTPAARASSTLSRPSPSMPPFASPANKPAGNPFSSPFAADSARKDPGPKMSSNAPDSASKTTSPFLISKNAPSIQPSMKTETSGALAMQMAEPEIQDSAPVVAQLAPSVATQAPVVPEASARTSASNGKVVDSGRASADMTVLRDAMLNALESAGQIMFVTMIEKGEWSLSGNQLTVKAPVIEKMATTAFTSEIKKLAQEAATRAAGSLIRVIVLGGGKASNATSERKNSAVAGTARSRAMEEPLVKMMQQKFQAEIRTVIDHTEKK
jgi:DNA polymerase-3 subunit gamma/tau